MSLTHLPLLAALGLGLLHAIAIGAEPGKVPPTAAAPGKGNTSELAATNAQRAVLETPGIAAFWDFREDPGNKRISLAPGAHAMEEMAGPVAREADGPFGTALHIKSGQWLRIPRDQLGSLNIHGPRAQVTVMAWVRRERPHAWQAIAGVWDESRKKRQYCLFLNAASRTDHRTMKRKPSKDLFQGHVSSVGGPTPGEEFCITYASSGSVVAMEGWHCLTLTYDAREVRLYLDGRFDASEGSNPFPYAEGLFDGGEGGAEFTVGSVSVRGRPGNFFGGRLGGLAVFQRALSAEEIAALHTATALTKAPE
ncbi:LamG-like jellyroll fold domain-containing protein [Verrucomicrobium spinosum]|uniref:LamG-like jellyroll fold domain-containing protein n=1 Tax=Verrucomicrobium spinosum TaxID=2736 RepID=UPI0001746116|nr:LamG-like jellyroll fold domain-containing protein [Verrucomicrobium spinosum]